MSGDTVLGVDWYRRGWVAVVRAHAGFPEVLVGADLAALVGRVPDAGCVAVDMPIGLPDSERPADGLARAFVGPRYARGQAGSLPEGAEPGERRVIWY